MRSIITPVVAAFACVAVTSASLVAVSLPVAAQDSGNDQVKQVALTDAQIQHFLAAKKDVDAVVDALPDSAGGQPDAAAMAKLDAIAKKNGFADANEYELVDGNIELVLSGFDPQTKKYIGPEAVIKQQIAQVQGDKTMKPKDKTETLAQLNESLKEVAPIQNKGNIDLVSKYVDKLAAVMSQD